MERTSRRWELLQELESWIERPMLVLGVAWLAIVTYELAGGSNSFLTIVAMGIWLIFIAEFLLRLALAPAWAPFLRRNWLTILALLVPALRVFRALAVVRAARVLRGARLLRIVGTVNRSMGALGRTLSRRGFNYVLGLTAVVLLLGAAGMLSFEPAREVDGGFASYGHALWWTGMLVASIGTDFWPQTPEGRLLSAMLALYGLAVFGYITATLASYFIGRDAEAPAGEIAGATELRRLRQEIAGLRAALASR